MALEALRAAIHHGLDGRQVGTAILVILYARARTQGAEGRGGGRMKGGGGEEGGYWRGGCRKQMRCVGWGEVGRGVGGNMWVDVGC